MSARAGCTQVFNHELVKARRLLIEFKRKQGAQIIIESCRPYFVGEIVCLGRTGHINVGATHSKGVVQSEMFAHASGLARFDVELIEAFQGLVMEVNVKSVGVLIHVKSVHRVSGRQRFIGKANYTRRAR